MPLQVTLLKRCKNSIEGLFLLSPNIKTFFDHDSTYVKYYGCTDYEVMKLVYSHEKMLFDNLCNESTIKLVK